MLSILTCPQCNEKQFFLQIKKKKETDSIQKNQFLSHIYALELNHFRSVCERGNGCFCVFKIEYLGVSVILGVHAP